METPNLKDIIEDEFACSCETPPTGPYPHLERCAAFYRAEAAHLVQRVLRDAALRSQQAQRVERPTVPGWYWARAKWRPEVPLVVCVIETPRSGGERQELVVSYGGGQSLDNFTGWSGPLQEYA